MTKTDFRPAVLAILALGAGLAASPAFAQDRLVAPFGAVVLDGRPAYAQPVVEAERLAVAPNVAGHYTCAFNEPHYRLERKNCGGVHYRY